MPVPTIGTQTEASSPRHRRARLASGDRGAAADALSAVAGRQTLRVGRGPLGVAHARAVGRRTAAQAEARRHSAAKWGRYWRVCWPNQNEGRRLFGFVKSSTHI